MEKVIGTRMFGNRVDITDPCYDHEVWCRKNDVEIVPGEYECYVEIWDNSQTGGWGDRVAKIGIRRLGSAAVTSENLGVVGVDAGLAGFFENKRDFTDDEWREFCQFVDKDDEKAWLVAEGFFSSSGYGDGAYPVYAFSDSTGRVVALEIWFIYDDEEDDEDDYEEEYEDEYEEEDE